MCEAHLGTEDVIVNLVNDGLGLVLKDTSKYDQLDSVCHMKLEDTYNNVSSEFVTLLLGGSILGKDDTTKFIGDLGSTLQKDDDTGQYFFCHPVAQ